MILECELDVICSAKLQYGTFLTQGSARVASYQSSGQRAVLILELAGDATFSLLPFQLARV